MKRYKYYQIKQIMKDDAFKLLLWKWFEETIENKPENKPKFKIWDYAACDFNWSVLLYKIDFMCIDKGWHTYQWSIDGNKLRKPTQEELDLYFR